MNYESLFEPFKFKSLNLKNRFVIAPMTRSFSPNGIPGSNVIDYYRKRAESEVGLIISEGTVIERPAASNESNIPHFYGNALGDWQKVIDGVHHAGGSMGPQLWHMGIIDNSASGWLPDRQFEGPSDTGRPGFINGKAMSENDIADTIAAFGRSAADAKRLGFDFVEIHGAHGYLIDQFFWEATNNRTDNYGGTSLAERTRFAVEIIKEIRRQTGQDFAIGIRLSQFKQFSFDAKLVRTPQEMEAWLTPLADAGVDIFHCSQRRFWEPEFDGSDLNFAGWAKKLSGKITISVGSVGLSGDMFTSFAGKTSEPSSLEELMRRIERGDFDLIAVGRAILQDKDWVKKIKEGKFDDLSGFDPTSLRKLD